MQIKAYTSPRLPTKTPVHFVLVYLIHYLSLSLSRTKFRPYFSQFLNFFVLGVATIAFSVTFDTDNFEYESSEIIPFYAPRLRRAVSSFSSISNTKCLVSLGLLAERYELSVLLSKTPQNDVNQHHHHLQIMKRLRRSYPLTQII